MNTGIVKIKNSKNPTIIKLLEKYPTILHAVADGIV
jgi:hypothetical protein